jgi:thiol-disulfide isomerase/thioredoxin
MRVVFLLFLLSISLKLLALDIPLVKFDLPIYQQDKSVKLEQYLGKKWIVINFFASWCTSCIEELPELHQLQKRYPKVLFLAINAGERTKIVKKFLKKYPFHYTILLDKKRIISKQFGVETLPRTLVISKEGKIIFSGNRPPKMIEGL